MNWMYFAALLALASCSAIRVATPLSPGVTDPRFGVWVYVQSTRPSENGVYRCKDAETKDAPPSCEKASW